MTEASLTLAIGPEAYAAWRRTYPGAIARMMAPADPWLGRRTTFGAAFIALAATNGPQARGD